MAVHLEHRRPSWRAEMRGLSRTCTGMRIQTSPEVPIRISPHAKVLPANTLRFYIHFPRSGEAHFDRDHLWLLNEEERVVRDPFLVLSHELWSVDGRRLTVLMEPGRIKRGLGVDPSHEPALVVGRMYSLVVTALGQTARHTFRVSDPVLEAVDETPLASRLPNSGEPRSRRRALRQGYGRRPLPGRDRSPFPFRRGHSDACVTHTGRNRSAAHPEPPVARRGAPPRRL
jgi:hypothetical protein